MKTEADRAPRTSACEELIAYIARHMLCDSCGSSYGLDDVQVLSHHEFQWSLGATCPVCALRRRVTAYDQPPYERLVQRQSYAPVDHSDVAEWAAYLADFDGDMADLLDGLE
jgi:hypothetical protein